MAGYLHDPGHSSCQSSAGVLLSAPPSAVSPPARIVIMAAWPGWDGRQPHGGNAK